MTTMTPTAGAALPMLDQTHARNTAASQATASGTGAASQAGNAPNVTSADFLTLLVSELKNQDPTQPTDPQAYVQQLVGVNSLQQLISINTDLGGNSSSSTTKS